jgi:hypothetical protein
MYFKYFDTFNYLLNSKDYELVDIFKKIAFTSTTLNNKKVFFDYYVVDGDSLENISNKFYNDPSLSWFILLCNNFTNRNEFPQSIDLIEQTANAIYPGSSLYFWEYIPNMLPGDFLVKCTVSGETITAFDVTKYAVVQEYNSIFRYAIVTENVGLTFDDYIAIKRGTGNTNVDVSFNVVTEANGATKTRSFSQIKRITKAIDSPSEFLNSNNNYLSPYYVTDLLEVPSNAIGIYPTGTLSDLKTVRNTKLSSFISNPSSVGYKSIFNQYLEDNNKNRIIKIMNPQYLNFVFEAIQELLSDNTIRTKVIDL